jgi:hypothetical protein
MPIVTHFAFRHRHTGSATDLSLLGPILAFLGGNSHAQTWTGTGFNSIWRPNNSGETGPENRFLELNMTQETLSFTNITGSGVANRGFVETDRFLGALSYLQQVSDVITGPIHFEPGVWANIPATSDPQVVPSVTRMGSIPHGTTINAQGTSIVSPTGQPVFTPASIVPFTGADDGTNLKNQPENLTPIATTIPSRTPLAAVPGLDDAHFQNPTLFLSDVVNKQNITATTVFIISTDPTVGLVPPAPTVGGGITDIEMLVGLNNQPNANATRMTATFWVETVDGPNGPFQQLQYTQRVLLNFGGLTWPHISVATLI